MDHHRDHELPGIARYLSDLSDDSGQASLPHSSGSESEFVEPEQAGPSKIDSRTLFFCEVCEIECSSVEVLQDHFAGTRHQKKLRLKGLSSNLKTKYDIKYEDELSGKVVECTLCKVIFHGLEQAFHFKSEKHRALCNFATESKIDNRQWLRVICDAPERSAEDEMMNMDEPEKVVDGYHCNLCSATMPTMTLFQAHIEGKRHQKKARWQYLCIEGDMSEVNQYWCRLCNMFCTDRDALTAHYRGRNHIKMLQKKNIIQTDDVPAEDKSGDTSRKKASQSRRIKSGEYIDDKKFHSRHGSKQYHYRDSRSESSERSYSPPLCSPIRSPSPPQPPLKQRNRSPWSYNRRFSNRSPSPSEASSYHSPERGGHSSKQNFHHHRQSRSSRSRSRERYRRDSFKSQGYPPRRDSNSQSRRNSSSLHSQRRYVSDSDSTQESHSSSLSRGRSMHRSRGRHQRIHSSSDSQSYSRSRSQHRHHSYSRSRSRSRDNRHRDKSSRLRGRSRGRARGGHYDDYGSSSRRGDRKRYMERRSSRPHVKREPQSEEDNELDRFKGFSRNRSSDESSGDAPPISSLSVSHILHALRKECRKL